MRAHPRVSLSLILYQVRQMMTPLLKGTYEEINGIKTYVATPKTDYPEDKVILYLTDVFGLELNNNCVSQSSPEAGILFVLAHSSARYLSAYY
jgi:hypothetical protein